MRQIKSVHTSWGELNESFADITEGRGIIFTALSLMAVIVVSVVMVGISVAVVFGIPTVLLTWGFNIVAPVFNSSLPVVTYGQSFAMVIMIKITVKLIKSNNE